jgi:hypothetical protein
VVRKGGYKAAGISLGLLVPMGLAWGGMMPLIFRQARASRYRVIQGGQG